MLKLKFILSKPYLLAHCLNIRNEKIEVVKGWNEFKNKLRRKDNNSFNILGGYPEAWLNVKNINLEKIRKTIRFILSTKRAGSNLAKRDSPTAEFNLIYNQTIQFRREVEKEWNKNKKKILSFLEENSGLKLPDTELKILIIHPKLNRGYSIPDSNLICWGHKSEWPNYHTVYLSHEIMHIITWNKDHSKIMHALIELLVDNELRINLNKKGQYFQKDIGHSNLLKLEKKIYPYWKEFLKETNKNLYQFAKKKDYL